MRERAVASDAESQRWAGRVEPPSDLEHDGLQPPFVGTFLSLFSGIGGLDLAVEALGFRCIGQVEWDESCSRVLARHWPDVPRWGDVATYPERRPDELRRGPGDVASSTGEGVGREADRERAEQRGASRYRDYGVDLICGGFPCQPVSHAGKRKAHADDRWLWPEFARVIRDLEPRWVVVENVPGLLSAGDPRGSAFGDILRDLASLGFDARWTSVRASEVGAPHRRERIFLLAERAAADEQRFGLGRPRPLTPGDRGQPQPRATPQLGLERTGGTWDRGTGPSDFPWGPYAPAIGRWARVMGPAPAPVDDKGRLAPAFVEWMMGFPPGWVEGMSRTQALKALGNAVVWPQALAALRSLAPLPLGNER